MARLTLVFSTFNGATTLPRMLDSLEGLEAPPGGVRIIAVDNGSTDATGRLLAERADRLSMTVLYEPRRGRSAGLNAALEAIEGDLVVFTDDDVVAPPSWLTSWRTLADRLPEFDIFGGAVRPIWPDEPPEWLLRLASPDYFAWTRFEEGATVPAAVWGPNMAVRRQVLDGRRFREDIGPNGAKSYAVGSETEFLLRAGHAGHRCWHAPGIAVGHIVEPVQLTPGWVLQRARNQARGVRRMWPDAGPAGSPLLLGLTPGLVRAYLAALANLARQSIGGGFEARFTAAHALARLEGDLSERVRLRFRRNRP